MWSETIYLQFPDETTAREMATSLGVIFPEDGSIPSGNHNYALCAPIQNPWISEPVYNEEGEITEEGVAESGYWAMLRMNLEWINYTSIQTTINNAGVVREIFTPLNVFA